MMLNARCGCQREKKKGREWGFVMNDTKVFIHGLLGHSQGTKATFLRERYPDMIIEDFRGTLEDRMHKLNTLLAGQDSIVVVGSSLGGLMAAMFAIDNQERVKKLILLAPALATEEFMPNLERTIDTPVIIFHGKDDDVVPLAPVQDIAHKVFKNLTFNTVDDDHVLSKTFAVIDWDNLL
jgi:pimeloyl-ACP methyl ester carboxylesterase